MVGGIEADTRSLDYSSHDLSRFWVEGFRRLRGVGCRGSGFTRLGFAGTLHINL